MKRCVLATSGIHVRPNGDIAMCCDQSSLGLNANNIGLLEAFNSEQFKQVRKNLKNDVNTMNNIAEIYIFVLKIKPILMSNNRYQII